MSPIHNVIFNEKYVPMNNPKTASGTCFYF